MHSWGQCNATLNLPLPVPAFTLAFKSLTVDWRGTASPGASQGQCVDTIAIQCALQASRRNMLLSNILMIAMNIDQTSIWRNKNTFWKRINIEKRFWTKGKNIRESFYQLMPMSIFLCHSNKTLRTSNAQHSFWDDSLGLIAFKSPQQLKRFPEFMKEYLRKENTLNLGNFSSWLDVHFSVSSGQAAPEWVWLLITIHNLIRTDSIAFSNTGAPTTLSGSPCLYVRFTFRQWASANTRGRIIDDLQRGGLIYQDIGHWEFWPTFAIVRGWDTLKPESFVVM